MPVISGVTLNLDAEQVLRRMKTGSAPGTQPKLRALLEECLEALTGLTEPRFVYEILPVADGPSPDPATKRKKLGGMSVPPQLRSSVKLGLVVCTIGPTLERQASEYFARGEPLRAILLDSIGNAALQALTKEALQQVGREAKVEGLVSSPLVKPGALCWPISNQKHLFRLVSPERIGVSLTDGLVMSPRKSTSFAVGLGIALPAWMPGEACNRCSMGRICGYRVRPA